MTHSSAPLSPSSSPVTVAVTGAAGQIAYSLLFRIAAGELFGTRPVHLQLLDIEPAQQALKGVKAELLDSAFPALLSIEYTSEPEVAFKDAETVFLIGSQPRGAGETRADLLKTNGAIFSQQAQAIKTASPDVRVLVVGNPANTNAYIFAAHAENLPKNRISALMRLDHNRALSSLADHIEAHTSELQRMTVWGNHSATQFPDTANVTQNGAPIGDSLDTEWLTTEYIPGVVNRGAEIIALRGHSSAASAAGAAIDHMRNWFLGTPENDWVSVALPSDGSYGVPEGLVYGFPCASDGTDWHIVQGLELSEWQQDMMQRSTDELLEEAATAQQLGLV